MRVTVTKLPNGGIRWEALRSDHTKVTIRPGGPSDGLPHDLAHYAVESALGMEFGFWGCIAAGGSLRITRATQRKGRNTRTGRGVLRDHAQDLAAAEDAISKAVAAWTRREPSRVTDALDTMLGRWEALRRGEAFVLVWPTPPAN